MRYMALCVEVIPADPGVSDNEIRSAIAGTLSGAALKSWDGCVIGHVVHVQVTERPTSTREASDG